MAINLAHALIPFFFRWVPVGKVDRLFIYPLKSAKGVEVKHAVVRQTMQEKTIKRAIFFTSAIFSKKRLTGTASSPPPSASATASSSWWTGGESSSPPGGT